MNNSSYFASCLVIILTFFQIVEGTPATAEEEKPFGLIERTPWTTSRVVGTPDPAAPYTVKRIFPNLKFQNPVFIAQEPGTDRLVVGQSSGKIYAFDGADPHVKTRALFLDIGRELYAFSFHPDYDRNRLVFTFSPKDPKDESKDKKSRVSSFTTTTEHPRTAQVESEIVIIEWPAGGHNGGEAIIGPDGYLYIATGDGSGGSDVNQTGQGVEDLLAVIMRIDVDHRGKDKPYSIPVDNPFVHLPGARPEIWAFGFRNPWRMSFDSKTGDLWVGDVGQDLWEMIWMVQRGGNYGWSVQEGTRPFHPNQEVGPGPILPPIIEHHHSECRSITGGYVYRDQKLAELEGAYIYADYEYGKIWGVRYDGKQVTWHQELANTALRIPTLGVSQRGEILVFDYQSGELYELVRNETQAETEPFPEKLSEAGIFSSVKDHATAPGIIPYSVNVPQWSDNAVKQRFLGLPENSQIDFVERSGDASTWGFKDGTVIFETLALEMEIGNSDSTRRIETRMLVKQENHWLGYSYVWNDEQTDATLVDAPGRDLVLTIKDPAALGNQRQQTWRIPSRDECMVCHSRAAGFVLGLRTEQANMMHDYGGVIDNQLRAMNHIGLFSNKIEKKPSEFESLPNPYDDEADVGLRARAYLHVNCSVCHVSDGGGNAKMQLRFHQQLADTKLVNELPLHGDFGLADGRIVKPGDPFASVLFYRLSKMGRGRMPHVGSNLTDEKGLQLIHDWIRQLPTDNESSTGDDLSKEIDEIQNRLQVAYALPAAEREQMFRDILSTTRSAFIASRSPADDRASHAVDRRLIDVGMTHPDANVRDLYERFLPEQERIARLGDRFSSEQILGLTGDRERGREFFTRSAGAQCKSCHSVNGKHEGLGPDLSEIGKKYKPRALLDEIINPSRNIDPKYLTHVVITIDGQVHTGVLVEKNEQHVILKTFKDAKTELLTLAKSDVDDMLAQKKSLMPDGLLRDLTVQQAADLLAYLLSLKQ